MTELGSPMRRFDVCESTSSEAAAWARDRNDPAPHGALVVAARQSAGRGRLGRRWESLGGEHIYMSLVLRPPLPAHRVPPLALCAGLAVHRVVRQRGADARIKWPNDILVGGRKLAGVLVETSQRGDRVEFAIVGIGINVNASGDVPDELGAIDLAAATGRAHDPALVRADVCAALGDIYHHYLAAGTAALEAAFLQAAVSRVAFVADGVRHSGDVVGLAPDGSLRVVDGQGREQKIIAGEVAAL